MITVILTWTHHPGQNQFPKPSGEKPVAKSSYWPQKTAMSEQYQTVLNEHKSLYNSESFCGNQLSPNENGSFCVHATYGIFPFIEPFYTSHSFELQMIDKVEKQSN